MTPNLALRLLLQCVRSDLLEHFLPASQKIFLWYVEKIPNLSLALSIQDFEYCIKELQDQTIQERKSGREQFFNFCVRQLSDDSFFPASSSPAASSPVLAQGSPSSAAPLSDQLSALAAVASEVSNTARAPVPAPSVAPAVSRSVSSASTPLAMQLISPTSTVVTAGVRPSFAADSISTQGDGGNKKEKGSDQDVELVENKQRDARGDDEEEDKEEVIVEVSRKRKSSGDVAEAQSIISGPVKRTLELILSFAVSKNRLASAPDTCLCWLFSFWFFCRYDG